VAAEDSRPHLVGENLLLVLKGRMKVQNVPLDIEGREKGKSLQVVPMVMREEYIHHSLSLSAGAFHQLIAKQPDARAAVKDIHRAAIRCYRHACGIAAKHIFQIGRQ